MTTFWLGRAYEFVLKFLSDTVFVFGVERSIAAGFVFSTANQWFAHPNLARAMSAAAGAAGADDALPLLLGVFALCSTAAMC